jgi:predicted ferric reductase
MSTIKALGKYTRTLADSLHVGQAVVWKALMDASIFRESAAVKSGLAEVLASRLSSLVSALPKQAHPATVDLFYSTHKADPAFMASIRELAEQKGVRFYALEEKDGLLTLDRIEALAPDWKQAAIWFCGPSGFGQALRQPMIERGLPASHFHQKLFEMR